MSNVYKLQIWQGHRWNIYAHSFLYYGADEAWNRMGAYLTRHANDTIQVYNPCLAGGAHLKFSSNIYYKDGHEIWRHRNSSDIEYSITLIND